MDPRARLRAGAELFNARRYHDAHEAFEDLWEAGEGPYADLYKGLIQAAICLHHFADGNLDGARALYRGHRRYLAAYVADGAGVDVGRLLGDVQAFLRPVLRAAPGEPVAFDAAAAPRIHFESEVGGSSSSGSSDPSSSKPSM